MSREVTIGINVTPGTGAETVALRRVHEIDNISILHYTLEGGATDDELVVSALAAAGAEEFLLVFADDYRDAAYPDSHTPGTPDISFKIHLNTEAAIDMAMPVFLSKNVSAALGAAGSALDSLFFSNAAAAVDYEMIVIVGWNNA